MPAGPRTTPYPVVVQFSDPNNPITPVKLLESSSLFVNSLSAVTISATNYVNLPAIGGATSVFQLDGTGVFVLSSTNNSLSSLVSNIELSTIALSAYIAANEGSWLAGGAGATYLSALLDVDVSSNNLPKHGDMIYYSSSVDGENITNKWVTLESDVNGLNSVLKLINDGNGGLYPSWDLNRLINLEDVFTPNGNFNANETIVYSSVDLGAGSFGLKFVPTPLPPYGFNEINCLIDNVTIGDTIFAGPNSTNLNVSSPNNTIIAYGINPEDGLKVLNLSVSNIFLSSNLQDVNVTSVSQGDSLVWDGSYWVPSAIDIPSIDLTPYVLTSVNSALSSTVTGHIDDETIHFTSGSLSSAYALSSWVNANFIDNTEITQYATTGSLLPYALTATLSNYLLTSVNVTSLAGTSTFETSNLP